ncbi:hypothetical protein CTI14_70405, partial [Methylobacterium radiotolerans]
DDEIFSQKRDNGLLPLFGTPLMLNGAPSLEESGWKALPTINDDEIFSQKRDNGLLPLFGTPLMLNGAPSLEESG